MFRLLVAYVEVAPIISNCIPPIMIQNAVEATSLCGLDLSKSDRDSVASVDT